MKKPRYIYYVVPSLLFFIASFLFFRFNYSYHIHYQEQYQLFESTWDYFNSIAWVPGGMVDYLGRFLTQFFYHANTGALILSLLLVLVQFLCFRLLRRNDILADIISFIPAIMAFIFLLDENALIAPILALIFCLFISLVLKSLPAGRVNRMILVLGGPLLYFAIGPMAIVFILINMRKEGKWFWIISLAEMLLCPWLFSYIVAYPLNRLYTGVHYYRYHNIFPLYLWLSVASSVILFWIYSYKFLEIRTKAKNCLSLCIFVFLSIVSYFAIDIYADYEKEEHMHYDFMMRYQMWNRIMMEADKNNPKSPMTVSCLNLALAQSGRMGDHMFEYYQNGPDGLFPAFQKDPFSPLSTAEIFYQLGMNNAALRYVFEAQESIPDFQKSARLYTRLTELNYINSDLESANKYLGPLKNTCFYRKWAMNFIDRAPKEAKYSELASMRMSSRDYLISESEMYSMLGLLYLENRDNDLAYQYLMSYCLLIRRLDLFMDCLKLKSFDRVPKHYQEAAILFLAQQGVEQDQIPAFIRPELITEFLSFIEAQQSKLNEEQIKSKYSGTYWLYYYAYNN